MSSIPADETKGKDLDELVDKNNEKNEESAEKTLDVNQNTIEETAKDNVNQEETPAHNETDNKHIIISPFRRIRPGTATEDIILGIPLDLSESDPWFHQEDRLTQMLSNVDPSTITAEEAAAIAAPSPDLDPNVWIYEWLRRLTRDLNLLVVAMLEDGCSSINCPEMRTLDCQYLCATHEKPRECPATDYIVHTLDYTTALLNSSKLFPSRVMIQDGPVQYLHSSARRLYRIFIHAHEHHNEMFRAFENETGMYTIFLAFAERYGLVPRELITIPPDYRDMIEDQDEYSRPNELGTLYEVDPTHLTNGDVE